MNFTAFGLGVSSISLILGIARSPSVYYCHEVKRIQTFGAGSIIATLRLKRSPGAGLRPGSTRKKCSKTRCFLPDKELLPKRTSGHILRPLTCPPLQTKVSQAEIEAGDCEGRLPLLFGGGLGSLVFGL